MNLAKLLLIGCAVSLLTACTRNVDWEEEVLLNTGETIVVKRSGSYTYQGLTSDGNHFRYVPDWRSTIWFEYKGKEYKHTDEIELLLLSIGPDGAPRLVSIPNSEWNSRNKFDDCVVPYYVELRPDGSGRVWTWPKQISPWLYNLPTNLMFGFAPIAANGKRFTPTDRDQKNAKSLQEKHLKYIDPSYSYENTCLRKN